MDIITAIVAATTIIGFLSTWIKMGVEKGEQKRTILLFEQNLAKNNGDIEELKRATHDIRVEIARSFAKIEVTLEHIKETVEDLKPRGGRHAAEK